MQIVTVREWFRLDRAARWQHWQSDYVIIYFRSGEWERLLTKGVELRDLLDYQKLIENGPPVEAFLQLKARMPYLSGITE